MQSSDGRPPGLGASWCVTDQGKGTYGEPQAAKRPSNPGSLEGDADGCEAGDA